MVESACKWVGLVYTSSLNPVNITIEIHSMPKLNPPIFRTPMVPFMWFSYLFRLLVTYWCLLRVLMLLTVLTVLTLYRWIQVSHKACAPMYKLGFNCAKFVQFRHLAAVVELIKPKTLKSYNTDTDLILQWRLIQGIPSRLHPNHLAALYAEKIERHRQIKMQSVNLHFGWPSV